MNGELEELKRNLIQNPKDAGLLRRLGQLYLNNHFFKCASEEYSLSINFDPRITSEIMLDHERIIEKEPFLPGPRLSLISFMLKSEDIEAALLELEEFLEIDPANVKVYNLLGRLYIALDRTDSALLLLEKALEFGIKDIGISQMLANVYLKKGRLEQALLFFEELQNHCPNDINTLRTLSELYTRTNQYTLAAERLGQLFLSDPGSSHEVIKKLEALLLKEESNVAVREILADIYMKTLKPDHASNTLKEILLLDANKIDFVIGKIKTILKNYPHHREALLTLASVKAQKGEFSEAIECYKELIRHHPDFTGLAVSGCKDILHKFPEQYLAHQFLAEIFLSQSNFQEAMIELKTILNLHKDSAEWVLSKCRDTTKKEPLLLEITGYAYLNKGQADRAQSEAEALLQHDKAYAPAHILLGNIYLKKNLTRKAQTALLNALRIRPHDISIHHIFREAKLKELKLEEETIKKRICEGEKKAGLHLELAEIYIKMGLNAEALKELQLAGRDPDLSPAAYNLIADIYLEEGNFNLAQAVIKKILEESKDQSVFHRANFKLAYCYEAQGNIKKAIKILEEILSLNIEYPCLNEKIRSLKTFTLNSLQNKRLSLVIESAQLKKFYACWAGEQKKSSGKKPNITASFGLSHNNAGFDYYIKGMLKAAMEEFDLSSKIDPAFTAAINNLGVVYVALERTNEAIQKLKESFRGDPASPIIFNNLGVSYFLSGDLEQAEKYLSQSLEIDPEFSAAGLNLGDISYLKGNAQKAIQSYESVQKHDLLYSLAQKRLLYKIT